MTIKKLQIREATLSRPRPAIKGSGSMDSFIVAPQLFPQCTRSIPGCARKRRIYTLHHPLKPTWRPHLQWLPRCNRNPHPWCLAIIDFRHVRRLGNIRLGGSASKQLLPLWLTGEAGHWETLNCTTTMSFAVSASMAEEDESTSRNELSHWYTSVVVGSISDNRELKIREEGRIEHLQATFLRAMPQQRLIWMAVTYSGERTSSSLLAHTTYIALKLGIDRLTSLL